MKCYVFRVVVEPDEERWHAYCPALEKYAAATWGYTREETLKNIQEVVQMVMEELAEDKESIGEGPSDTFRPKTLKRMIEDQAKWAKEDMILH